MKRIILSKYFIFTFIILLGFFLYNSNEIIKNVKRFGSEQYYVKISDEVPIDNGSDHWKYTYQLDGYSSVGAKKILRFDADRMLRRDAYLRIYVHDDGAVVSWEEVPLLDVPAGAQKHLVYSTTPTNEYITDYCLPR